MFPSSDDMFVFSSVSFDYSDMPVHHYFRVVNNVVIIYGVLFANTFSSKVNNGMEDSPSEICRLFAAVVVGDAVGGGQEEPPGVERGCCRSCRCNSQVAT
jgi:hypothetical protein